MVDISVVIRTFNEERYLGELLTAINTQDLDGLTAEVVLVDSGSTDNTVAIAQKHNCRIVRISKAEFTFGRSLNLGCGEALGSYLIFISGHCVPTCSHWLMALTEPLREQGVV